MKYTWFIRWIGANDEVKEQSGNTYSTYLMAEKILYRSVRRMHDQGIDTTSYGVIEIKPH